MDTTAYTHAGLSKLTVAQLKAMCKEKRITGYSKLGKNAIVQKLVDSGLGSGSGTPTIATTTQPPPRADRTSVQRVGPSQVAVSVTSACSEAQATHRASRDTAQETDIPPGPKPKDQSRRKKPARPESTTNDGTTSNLGKHCLAHSSVSLVPTGNSDNSCKSVDGHGLALEIAPLAQAQNSFQLRPSAECMPPPAKRPRIHPPSFTPVNAPREFLLATARTTGTSISKDSALGVTHPQPATASIRQRSSLLLAVATSTRNLCLPETTLERSRNLVALATATTTATSASASAHAASVSNKRFVPLVVDRSKLSTLSTGHSVPTTRIGSPGEIEPPKVSHREASLASLEEFVAPVPILRPINIPPSLAQRKRVYCWAVVLSGLTDKERAVCVLVSRAFRYAIYLSASCSLTGDFRGRRLQEDVLKKYSQAMTNMWPYLRAREDEAAQRWRIYRTSFLARFFQRYDMPAPIADPLWASPDNPKQLAIAIRFALTRAWFELSVGSVQGGKDDPDSWLHGTVVDVQEVVACEIWSVAIQYCAAVTRPVQREVLYVLEATCEVVGRPSQQEVTSAFPVRADWSEYIARRTALSCATPPLLSHLKWACVEEYDQGISKLWLKRIAAGDPLGELKKTVAERYVMACVVGNGISGPRMSVNEMTQDFAGLRERVAAHPVARMKPRMVNLYLPEHHHVESVHFASARGESLHTALAVVQTPHREYFVLRDNGMQIGCEEEGVADVWQEVLRCDHKGMSRV